jgi:hypothetical protein
MFAKWKRINETMLLLDTPGKISPKPIFYFRRDVEFATVQRNEVILTTLVSRRVDELRQLGLGQLGHFKILSDNS